MSDEPRIGIGHVALVVSDVAVSARFYADLGLTPCFENAGMAILELRGGTHLLLFSRDTGPAIPAVERVDLMIAERSRAALEAYRDGILARGLEAGPIPDEDFYGHHMLRLRDPDGNEVVVATSHCRTAEG
jgi:catechol 2,3-dioxygenase-like lactoylglutathione lyase family enzyme